MHLIYTIHCFIYSQNKNEKEKPEIFGTKILFPQILTHHKPDKKMTKKFNRKFVISNNLNLYFPSEMNAHHGFRCFFIIFLSFVSS